MEKETVLEIGFIQVLDRWAWKIEKQDEFIFTRDDFEDKELKIFSYSNPGFDMENEVLFLRGRNINLDHVIYLCTEKEKEKIEEKVKIINEKYGKQKKWRAEKNGEYYYINHDGTIYLGRDYYISTDNDRYNLGNYFQTREQAERALERVKEAYQEVGE